MIPSRKPADGEKYAEEKKLMVEQGPHERSHVLIIKIRERVREERGWMWDNRNDDDLGKS